jgi:hypothetical protein
MWLHQADALLRKTIDEGGLRSGKRLAEAMSVHLERANAEIDRNLQTVNAEVAQLEQAYTRAMDELRSFTALTAFFMRSGVREAKAEAIRNRNLAISRRVEQEALKLARDVFMDPTQGLLAHVQERIAQIRQVLDATEAAQTKLSEEVHGIETGDESASRLVGAPDRSVLLYDVVRASRFAELYGSQPEQVESLKTALIGERSPLQLLEAIREDDKAAVLRDRTLKIAEGYYREATDRHLLDVLTEGAKDSDEREAMLKEALRRVVPNLSPNLPTRVRRGDGSAYDYCVILYPHHPDTALVDTFKRVATSVLYELRGLTVQLVPDEGPKNRILMTTMQHGVPLNADAFPEIRDWMRAYELLRARNASLDVDRRWMKYPGPEQRDTGQTREKLFALGLAYGLIAQQGDFYYTNFQADLLRRDPSQQEEREQVEVDLEKVSAALQRSRSPLEWFGHLTFGPSDAPTIPVEFKSDLGTGERRDSRDCIGQGRHAAMRAFVEDTGEDYADVANAITAVLTAYAEERGRASVREELTWYVDQLQDGMTRSSQLKEQYERELFLLVNLMETLEAEGDFGLPEPL